MGRGKNILLGTAVKVKVDDLDDGVREGFYTWLIKELNFVVESISSKRRFLARFQYGCEKDLTSNHITVVTVDRIPMNEEAEVPMISTKTEEEVDLYKGYYNVVCVFLDFNKEEDIVTNEEETYIKADPEKEYMEYMTLNNEMERHWRAIF